MAIIGNIPYFQTNPYLGIEAKKNMVGILGRKDNHGAMAVVLKANLFLLVSTGIREVLSVDSLTMANSAHWS
jgi:hypothetical protein